MREKDRHCPEHGDAVITEAKLSKPGAQKPRNTKRVKHNTYEKTKLQLLISKSNCCARETAPQLFFVDSTRVHTPSHPRRAVSQQRRKRHRGQGRHQILSEHREQIHLTVMLRRDWAPITACQSLT